MTGAKWWIAAGIGGVVLVAGLAAGQDRRPAGTSGPSQGIEVEIPTAQEVRAMLGAYGARVEEHEQALGALRDELAAARKELVETMAALRQERQQDLGVLSELFQKERATEPPAAGRFRVFEFGDAPRRTRAVQLPAGSFGEATLLTGVYAPTNGEPLPVLIRLDAALIGPRRSRIPIEGAFLVGKAVGDANSRRAVVQLDTLSFVRSDGRTVEARVNGWVMDDDGVQGLRGRYVWRAEEIAALAAATGGLSAAADALASGETEQSLTPLGGAVQAVSGDAARFAAFRGAGETARKIGEVVAARLAEITPAVHVDNGKRIAVAFIGGVALEGLEVDDAQAGRDAWRDLDAGR